MLNAFRRQSVALAERVQPLRVLLALGSLLALCAATGKSAAVIPLFLGVIASALAETDDSWQGRLGAQSVTLICFAAIAFAVEALIGAPWLLCGFLGLSAFCLTMMGAIEARYKSIGFATLALALYATIGLDGQTAGSWARHREAPLLLAGAACYGVLSIASSAAFPTQPVQAQLIRLFSVLGNYVRFKASLFEPLRDMDVESKRLSLAQLNATVVAELNATKESVLRRAGATAVTGRIARYRGLYLIAQDVHERASSSHDDYNALANAFFHSDLLYRCQRVLALEAQACTQLARSIARQEPFIKDAGTTLALHELHSAIEHQRAQPATPERRALLASVDALAQNLAQLDGQLGGASQPLAQAGRMDMALSDNSPHSWREASARVRRQFSPGSLMFRHALRLAIALSTGFAVKQWIHPAQGYWILLTTLFVCQQNYGETVSRLVQRTAGTIVGVVIGWALVDLFPQSSVQALLAVAAGVLFFATRVSRYFLATAAITVLVLLCFSRVGNSDVLILPRLLDTAIGSLIAWFAVLLVFPHWQSRRFSELAAAAMRGHADYLRQITAQYKGGVKDDLAYRIARRNAHDADAALSTAVVDMYSEPSRVRPHARVALRLLIQSHTLLSYLSALGAHRDAMVDPVATSAFAMASEAASAALVELATALGGTSIPKNLQHRADPVRAALAAKFTTLAGYDPNSMHLSTELNLIGLQIDALQGHAVEWLELSPSGTLA